MAATVPRGKIQGPQQGEEKVWLLLNHRQERIFRIVDTNLYFLFKSISSETNKTLVMGELWAKSDPCHHNGCGGID